MKLSGYVTTRNTVEMDYPMEESLKSLLEFCDEVVVMDSSNGNDSTKDVLSDLKKQNNNLKLYTANVDWTAPNHGVFDGALKQAAREKCTGEFLWQSDIDEIVKKEDRAKLEDLLKQTNYLKDVPILCLPVVEYWGSYNKTRIDINPWKWRVSKNIPDITHGIPISHRKYENGLLYSKHGSDGCVTPETKIMTIKGEKPIIDITTDDLVLTHKGRFKKVTKLHKQPDKKHEIYKILQRNYFDKPLNITGNHPIYFSKIKKQYKKPWRNLIDNGEEWICLDDEIPSNKHCFTFPKLKTKTNENLYYEYKTKTSIKKIYPNKDIGFLIGLYLGDGYVSKRTENKTKFKNVSYSLSEYQEDVIDRIEKIIFNEFGIEKISKYKDEKKHYWKINVNNASFAELINQLCGCGSRNKRLNESFFEWNDEAISGLFEGLYQSDGANCRSGINIVMVNGELLSQLKTLATKINVFCSLTSYTKKAETSYVKTDTDIFQLRITGKQTEIFPWIEKNKYNNAIKRNNNFLMSDNHFSVACSERSAKIVKEIYEGHLYNIEVEDDHSYVANGITVHNCDYISKSNGNVIQSLNFMNPQIEQLRIASFQNEEARKQYEIWFNHITSNLPSVYHYSWFSIKSKIEKYKLFWTNFWPALYNETQKNQNVFFDNIPWEDVTEEMIIAKANELKEKTGGHIFHKPWNGEFTPSVVIQNNPYEIMEKWCEKHNI